MTRRPSHLPARPQPRLHSVGAGGAAPAARRKSAHAPACPAGTRPSPGPAGPGAPELLGQNASAAPWSRRCVSIERSCRHRRVARIVSAARLCFCGCAPRQGLPTHCHDRHEGLYVNGNAAAHEPPHAKVVLRSTQHARQRVALAPGPPHLRHTSAQSRAVCVADRGHSSRVGSFSCRGLSAGLCSMTPRSSGCTEAASRENARRYLHLRRPFALRIGHHSDPACNMYTLRFTTPPQLAGCWPAARAALHLFLSAKEPVTAAAVGGPLLPPSPGPAARAALHPGGRRPPLAAAPRPPPPPAARRPAAPWAPACR